jgi:hypothetical protein
MDGHWDRRPHIPAAPDRRRLRTGQPHPPAAARDQGIGCADSRLRWPPGDPAWRRRRCARPVLPAVPRVAADDAADRQRLQGDGRPGLQRPAAGDQLVRAGADPRRLQRGVRRTDPPSGRLGRGERHLHGAGHAPGCLGHRHRQLGEHPLPARLLPQRRLRRRPWLGHLHRQPNDVRPVRDGRAFRR